MTGTDRAREWQKAMSEGDFPPVSEWPLVVAIGIVSVLIATVVYFLS
jgi:hypothetical protein